MSYQGAELEQKPTTAAQREYTANVSIKISLATADHIKKHEDENCCCKKVLGGLKR
jgi:hypothetical protein